MALIIFFGSISYLLFPQVTVQGYTATVDVFTQHGGEGNDKPGGNFSVSKNETVILYVKVSNTSKITQGSCFVSFEIHWPALGPFNGSVYDVRSKEVNVSESTEIARIPIVYLQLQSRDPAGNWLVYAATSIDNQHLADTLTFSVP